MKITPFEADLLLFALDKFVKTSPRGEVPHIYHNWNGVVDTQGLRDRLMAHHEHPTE